MYSNNNHNNNNNSETTSIVTKASIISSSSSSTTITQTKDTTTNNKNNNSDNNNNNNTMDNLETKYYLEIVFILVLFEMLWRFNHCYNYIYIQFINMITFKQLYTSILPCFQFIISYILCMLTIWLGIKKWNISKHKILRDFLTILYGLDGIAALLLGYSIYIKNNWLTLISILISTKIFLLHFLSRMVTGLHAYTNNAIALQTTKTYLHHLGSFFFLSSTSSSTSLPLSLTSFSSLLLSPLPSSSSSSSYPTTTSTTFYVILITTLWRFISLSGHAQLSITHLLSPTLNYKLSWLLVHGRNISIIITFILIIMYDDIRRGFALSAVSHVHFMI
jgi:hypothetical protein